MLSRLFDRNWRRLVLAAAVADPAVKGAGGHLRVPALFSGWKGTPEE